jgi:hypothetical protein
LWVLGRECEAWKHAADSISLAKNAGHVKSLGYAYMHAVITAMLARRPERETLIAEMLVFTTEHRMEMWREYAIQFQALHHLQMGIVSALANLRSARLALANRHARVFTGYLALEAADALVSLNHLESAEALTVEAEDFVRSSGERFADAELLRMQALVHKSKGELPAARRLLEQSLVRARSQKALGWERRSLASIAELPA